jgi:ABC-2 type transport system ATP-binding protein
MSHASPLAPYTLQASAITVRYQISSRRFGSLKEYVISKLKGEIHRVKTFEALKDVSIRLERGECVGLIGRNGCGKSTLLQEYLTQL